VLIAAAVFGNAVHDLQNAPRLTGGMPGLRENLMDPIGRGIKLGSIGHKRASSLVTFSSFYKKDGIIVIMIFL
jgi:hypothetical protein